MAAIDDAITVLEKLAGRSLTQAQLASIAANWNASWGNEWYVKANPYDRASQPTEHAAWPENATGTQLATFMLAKMRQDAREHIKEGRGIRADLSKTSEMNAAEQEL